MKICLPCPGLEHTQRGFETYTRELFDALKGSVDVHLVKSSGKHSPREHVVPVLRRTSWLFSMLPKCYRTDYRRLQAECWSFAIGMIPLLALEKYDIIHFSELPLGDALKWIRARFGFRYKLLFSNGGPFPPWDCARFDAVHQVSPAHAKTGSEYGLPDESSFMVPYGTDVARLNPPKKEDRLSLRRKLGFPEKAFIVLSLAALNRHHKRIDWLIREFSKLEGDVFLVLAGNREDETKSLENLAECLLPSKNYSFMQLPYNEVPNLLHAADVMVQCSLDEGFGRVLTEAMGAGIPLLVHPHETAQWIMNNADCMVDMTVEGALAGQLESMENNQQIGIRIAEKNKEELKRFEWGFLVSDYISMYKKLL